jgi:predicted permease
VILLHGAAVTLRSFAALQSVDVGFRSEGVMTMQVPLPPRAYATAEARNRFAQELVERVRQLPGVEAVAIGNGGLPWGGPQSAYALPGQPRTDARVRVYLTNEDYLRVLSVPLRRGRMLTERDVRFAERNAVINEAAAALWPPDIDPIGQRMVLDALEPPASGPVLVEGTPSKEVTIVGVIANTRNNGLEAEPQPAILLPYSVLVPPQRQLAIRTSAPPSSIVDDVRSIVSDMDPLQPVSGVIAMDALVQNLMAQPRFVVALFSLFGALGLALAMAGVYAVLSYLVSMRTREIGIRMTLGARALDILRLVCTAGGKLITIGFVVGTAGALGVTRLIAAQLNLFGADGADPFRQVSVGLLLAVVALLACIVPAWRAAKVTPVDAMR